MQKILLLPFSWLYGIVVYFRNRMYDLNLLKSVEFDVPVISIGNITVGGTGKTPHVEYLVEILKKQFEVVTLSRGYKRKTKGFRWVETSSSVLEVGDEPLQIKRKFTEVNVSVCENRVAGVSQLLKGENNAIPDVVVLDDAFQHRRISPGINILLIDYNRPIKEDMLLPAGRLREGAYQIRRANIILFTKCPDEVTPIMQRILQKDVQLKPYQNLFFTKFVYQKIQPVFNAKMLDENFYQHKNYSILVITGIASPELVQKYLRKLAKSVETLAFPDHYNFTAADIEQIQAKFSNIKNTNKIIVTTEKDSMRLKELPDIPEEIKAALYYLPIKVEFLGKENKLFNKRILDYVGENKSNRELHKRKNTGKS